jgi:hypothetical protein
VLVVEEPNAKRHCPSSSLKEYDARFKTPFTCLLAGPSQSGKTSVVFNILRDRQSLFDVPTNNIFYFYQHWQPSFEIFRKEGLVTEWLCELPTIQVLEEKTAPFKDAEGSIVVIDDFMGQLNEDISSLFTFLCHSNRVSVFLMTQNVFAKNPVFRTISLNSQYVFIFKNSRDSSQITNYAKQFSPGDTDWVVDSFRECTRAAFSYLLFDHHQTQEEEIRVRSHILVQQWPMRVWGPARR